MNLNKLETLFWQGARVDRQKKDIEEMRKAGKPDTIVKVHEEQAQAEEKEYIGNLAELVEKMSVLNPLERTVIECRYIKGLSYPSILDALEEETGVRYSSSTIIKYRRKALEKMGILE